MKKLVLLLIGVLALSSCDRDGVGVTPGFVPNNASFDFDSKLPSNLESSNPAVSERVQQMKAMTNACGAMMINSMHSKTTVLAAASSNLPNHYTWSSGGYVIDYSYGIVGPHYEFEYTITINGNPYFTASGWQATDGTAGHWEANFGAGGTGNYNVVYDWTVNSAGDLHFDMHFDLGSTHLHYLFNLNHDGSGNISYYLSSTTTTDFYCTWDPNGHGYYTLQDQIHHTF
jgi:hypothetical protein